MRYLIDTDWAIDYLRDLPAISDQVSDLKPEGIGLSVVPLAELYEGIFLSRDPARSEEGLRQFLSRIELLALDVETCRIFGQEHGRLRGGGNLIGDMDILIGATALRHNLTLLTRNVRHFERIGGLAIHTP